MGETLSCTLSSSYLGKPSEFRRPSCRFRELGSSLNPRPCDPTRVPWLTTPCL